MTTKIVWRTHAVVGLVSLLLVSGCGGGSQVGSPVPAASTTSSTTSRVLPPSTSAAAVPDLPASDQWQAVLDPETGVGFLLPGEFETESRPGDDSSGQPAVRAFTTEVAEGFNLSVSFAESSAAVFSARGLDLMADGVVEQLTSAGSADAAITTRKRGTVAGHPVLDYQVSFTATTGKKSIWFTRIIGNESRAIMLQSIAFVEPGDVAAATGTVGKYHDELVAGCSIK